MITAPALGRLDQRTVRLSKNSVGTIGLAVLLTGLIRRLSVDLVDKWSRLTMNIKPWVTCGNFIT